MKKQKLKEGKATNEKRFLSVEPFGMSAAVAALVFIAVMFIYFLVRDNKEGLILSSLLAVAYICALFAVGIVIYLHEKSKFIKLRENPRIARTKDMPLGVLAALHQPITVCDADGRIVWMNRTFAHHTARGVLLSDDINVSDLLDMKSGHFVPVIEIRESDGTVKGYEMPESYSLSELLEKIKDSELSIETVGTKNFGDHWNVRVYSHNSRGNAFFILVLEQTTELHRQIALYNDNLAHIAYIAIDNLEELAQSEQESYRLASTKVDATIKEWADEYGIFIKEYEREKYVMVMTDENALRIEKTRYDILERVSRIKIGSDRLSVTVSIGVSNKYGSLATKDKQAQSALESALQRGGNQAVVISGADNTPRFYGAKAITSLKRSGVRHRVFADKLMRRINECSNVIIMGHRNPDFDAIGSCLGIARLAMSAGKKTNIIANPESPTLKECFDKLKGLSEYRDVFVDATQAQEMLTSETLVICADVNNPDNIEAPDVMKNADYLFMIDHHRQSEKTPEPIPEKREILIVPSASSASELVSEILELELPYNARLNREEADIMFAGILLDTKNFTRNAQVPTFGAAIYLRSAGADPVKAQALFKIDLDDFKQESAFTTDLEIYRDTVVIAKENGADSSPAKRIAAAKTADRLLSVKGMRASFVVTKMVNDVFISARSDGSVNVQLIMESLNGGGHYNAAATMIKECSVDDAAKRLKASVDAYFGNK